MAGLPPGMPPGFPFGAAGGDGAFDFSSIQNVLNVRAPPWAGLLAPPALSIGPPAPAATMA